MNWNKIALYLPTYRRSDKKLPEHLESFVKNASDRKNIYYIFVIQRHQNKRFDDYESEALCKRMMGEYGVNFEIIHDVNPNPSLARFYNRCYLEAKNKDEAMLVSMVGDDMLCRSMDWDARILETVNKTGGMGVYYTAGDERFDDALCVNAFMTRQWVDLCGGWVPKEHSRWRHVYGFSAFAPFMCPAFDANGIDIVWQRIADHVGRAYYLPDVQIQHEQWSRSHIGEDETSKRLGTHRKEATRRTNSRHRPHVEGADVIVNRLHRAGIGPGGTTDKLNGIIKGRSGRYWCYKGEVVKK
jgi:hypothetical protein